LSSLLFSSFVFFFSSRRRHTRSKRDWSSDVCSSDLKRSGGCCSPFLAPRAQRCAKKGEQQPPDRFCQHGQNLISFMLIFCSSPSLYSAAGRPVRCSHYS